MNHIERIEWPEQPERDDQAEQPTEPTERSGFPLGFSGTQRSLRTSLRPTTLEPASGEHPQPKTTYPPQIGEE